MNIQQPEESGSPLDSDNRDLTVEVTKQPPKGVMYSTKKEKVQYEYTTTMYCQDHQLVSGYEIWTYNHNSVST